MKKQVAIKILLVIVALLFSICFAACSKGDVDVDSLEYGNDVDGQYSLLSLGEAEGELLIIPKKHDGKNIESISSSQPYSYSFNPTNYYYVNTPSDKAVNPNVIKKVVVGDEIKEIKNFAFHNENIEEIEIGSGVKYISEDAFYACLNLKNITVSEDNKNYSSIDGNLYSKDGKTLIRYAPGKTETEFTVPDTVTQIAAKAFLTNQNVKKITLSGNVTQIGEGTFFRCISLEEVELGQKITEIPTNTFFNCYNLTKASVPSSVTKIGEHAFYYCTKLESVNLPSSVNAIGDGAFMFCMGLGSIDFPSAVTKISDYALYNCNALSSVTMGNDVTRIGDYALCCCTKMETIVVPSSVRSLGKGVFDACDSLTSVEFKDTTGWSVVGESGSTSIQGEKLSSENVLQTLADYVDYAWIKN